VSEPDTIFLTLTNGERVELWKSEFERFLEWNPGFVRLLRGDASQFEAFAVFVVDDNEISTAIQPEQLDPDSSIETQADPRLFGFAHFARPFNWMDDPRHDQLQELVRQAGSSSWLDSVYSVSTQDLMDALFIYGRGERFVDGLFDSYAVNLALVGNEVRRRLIGATGNNQTITSDCHG
jgi:hypothetical protein